MNHKFTARDKAAPLLVTMLMIALLSSGCSSFNREWRKAARTPPPADSMEGRWQGHWRSDSNGHNDALRCIVSRSSDGGYSARFKATYEKVLTFSYTVRLEAERNGSEWRFRGREDLGKLAGGIYEYEGTASATNFHSIYRSRYDRGTFQMQRPADD